MKRRVLLVDDDEGNRLSLSFMLEDEGFDVFVAASCAEARAVIDGAVAGDPLDVVVLDHHLGDGLGTALVPFVRAAMPKARIAMLSGEAVAGVGVDGVLTKGMDPAALLSAVRALAERQ